jgi:hypothetical protein
VSFNVGIEAGQLAFVFVVLLLKFALGRGLVGLPPWTRWVPVYGMGILVAFWTLERIAGL